MSSKNYWFPRNRHGLGWGAPIAWQGWGVLLAYFALLLGGVAVFDPRHNPRDYLLYAAALLSIHVFICWRKGEPAQSRQL